MKTIVTSKSILLSILLLLSAALIARVPIYHQKTILSHILSSFDKGHEDLEESPHGVPSVSDEVWRELKKISEHNTLDSSTITGTVRLYDNLNDEGIKEMLPFTFRQQDKNQWFHLDVLDRIQLGNTVVVVDHQEKEVTLQSTAYADSIVATMRLLSFENIKRLLLQDGLSATIRSEGALRVLNMKPGLMDAVNEYHIFYDSLDYLIQKITFSYTSQPYEDFVEDSSKAGRQQKNISTAPDSITTPIDPEIEMNITEYVIELDFAKKEHYCHVNFYENPLFKVVNGSLQLKERIRDYTFIQ